MTIAKGHSLIELTMVVAILGITALVVIPNYSAGDAQKIELAEEIVTEALRYARSEAMRSGELHGVLFDTDDGDASARDIQVFKADLAVSPFGNAGTLYHPLSKQPYDLWLDTGGFTKNVKFSNASPPFSFEGVVQAKKHIFFTAQGLPVYVADGVLSRFTGGDIVLAYDAQSRTITIQPTSGRVAVE
jgi:prepilin-type N-terminal cleavage/methylation domain-containing protein